MRSKDNIMIKNYFKIAWRNLMRHKSFSLLNISGLAIGLASSMLILSWVQHERGYDKFHSHEDRIFRITAGFNDDFKSAVVPSPLGPELKEKMAEVNDFVRVSIPVTSFFEYNNNRYEEKAGFYADSTFLNVFTFPLIAGDKATALHQPDGILMTERMAKKYFNDQNAIGKVLKLNNVQEVKVTGVLADIPVNSHLQFDYILPFTSLHKDQPLYPNEDWRNFIYYSYLRFNPGSSASPVQNKMLENRITDIYRGHVDGTLLKTNFKLQALGDIHLHSQNLQVDLAGHGNYQYVNTLFLVAVFILIVACINFMNLATARSARRAKEVGLRKVIGANRKQLIVQFLGEALLISYLSLMLAVALAGLFMPLFTHLSGVSLTRNFFNPGFMVLVSGIATLAGITAGLYPALYLSGFKPIKVLKGVFEGSHGGNLIFRNVLVVVQFVISISLLVGTIVAHQQLNYLKNRNLGFDKSGLVYVPMTGDIWSQQQAYRNALRENPFTSNFTIIDEVPSNLRSGTIDYYYEGKDPNSSLIVPTMDVGEGFFDVFDMQLIAGRSFSNQFGSDSGNYVVNETLVKIMGLTPEEAIDKPFSLWSKKGNIIGVVKDFNFKPASQIIEPLILQYNDWGGMIVVKAQEQQLEPTIKALEKINASLNPHFAFSYGFVDQDLEKLYRSEQRLSNLFNFFAALAIFVSCLGLYGLSAYIAERRSKEIGIRKILGSSPMNIFYLLSKSFLGLVIIAICIALPVSWYASSIWIEGFAYRIDISWGILVLASCIAVGTAMFTTSYQAWKSACINPVKSLRAE